METFNPQKATRHFPASAVGAESHKATRTKIEEEKRNEKY
jgi:hypothetical protein